MSDDPDPLDPDWARSNPEEAVDALEERVLGGRDHRLDGGHADDAPPGGRDPEPDDDAAFDVDLDPEDQGDADAAGALPD